MLLASQHEFIVPATEKKCISVRKVGIKGRTIWGGGLSSINKIPARSSIGIAGGITAQTNGQRLPHYDWRKKSGDPVCKICPLFRDNEALFFVPLSLSPQALVSPLVSILHGGFEGGETSSFTPANSFLSWSETYAFEDRSSLTRAKAG